MKYKIIMKYIITARYITNLLLLQYTGPMLQRTIWITIKYM